MQNQLKLRFRSITGPARPHYCPYLLVLPPLPTHRAHADVEGLIRHATICFGLFFHFLHPLPPSPSDFELRLWNRKLPKINSYLCKVFHMRCYFGSWRPWVASIHSVVHFIAKKKCIFVWYQGAHTLFSWGVLPEFSSSIPGFGKWSVVTC